MPVIRPGVRTKNEILADNIEGVVNYALDVRNHRRARIIADLRERYPDASLASVTAAYDHVIDSRHAAQRQQQQQGTNTIPLAQVPRNPTLPTQWQYTVETSWIDPNTGDRRYHTTVINSPTMLSNDLIAQQAIQQTLQERRRNPRRRTQSEIITVGPDDITVRITNIERR